MMYLSKQYKVNKLKNEIDILNKKICIYFISL